MGAAIDGMFTVIEPLGVYATTLPAGPSYPGLNAGSGFHFFRTVDTLPHRHAAAWLFFQTRLRELSVYSAELTGRPDGRPVLGEVASLWNGGRQSVRGDGEQGLTVAASW